MKRYFYLLTLIMFGFSGVAIGQGEHTGHGQIPAATPAADPHAGHKMTAPVTDGPWSYKGRKNPEPYTAGRWDMVPAGARTGAFTSTQGLSREERCATLRESPYVALDRATRLQCGIEVADAVDKRSTGQSPTKSGSQAAHSDHWMAPPDAAKRPNPIPKAPASLARGKQIYDTNCASCHGEKGKGDGSAGKALTPKPADLATMAPQHSPGDLAWKVENGRGPMPAFKGTLSQNDIWDVVNYIQTLGGPVKKRGAAKEGGADPKGGTGHKH